MKCAGKVFLPDAWPKMRFSASTPLNSRWLLSDTSASTAVRRLAATPVKYSERCPSFIAPDLLKAMIAFYVGTARVRRNAMRPLEQAASASCGLIDGFHRCLQSLSIRGFTLPD